MKKLLKKMNSIRKVKYMKIIFLLFINELNKKINKKLEISKKNQIIIKSCISNEI